MMDSGIDGYIVWHAFVRVVVLLFETADQKAWLQTDRNIGLSATVLAALVKDGKQPVQSNDPIQRTISLSTLHYLMNCDIIGWL